MKTKIRKTSIAVLVMSVITIFFSMILKGGYYFTSVENEFIRLLKEKFVAYNDYFPQDRVYLHFDKPFYQPGETIWFSAYVRNGTDLKPSVKSDILHVEMIGPKGNIEKSIKIVTKNGKAQGDFSLDEEAAGGLYKVRAYTNWQKNETDTLFFIKELQVQEVILPTLKMKLDFERKAFGAGDQVVARLDVNTNENKALQDYKVKYAAQIDGIKLNEGNAVTDNEGTVFIKFKLPEKLKTNDGLLNIMIDYQGKTESVSRSIPIVLNNIKFTFYPEGGDLVYGLESKVAFKAINEFGKPADVEGQIVDEAGSVLRLFSSYYQGMGAFTIIPKAGKKYYAMITRPEGIKEKYELPEALGRGYVMSADNTKPDGLAIQINTTENEELSVVAQMRGKIYYASSYKVVKGKNEFVIPTADFPMGVAQVTLFDSKGVPRAERLAFVNKSKQLNISVTTDKEKYLPREKVKMTITVKDDRGMPMPGNFSLSVVNDQLLSFADDKSGNILSQLFLEQDINEKIEEPAFYFTASDKADKALDYVMMTSGWRRYTWKQIIENDLPVLSNLGEKAIISGTILDAYTGKPIDNVTIKLDNGKTAGTTNKKGVFTIKNIDLSRFSNFIFEADGYSVQNYTFNDYLNNQTIYLYDGKYAYKTEELMVMAADGEREQVPMAAGQVNVKEEKVPKGNKPLEIINRRAENKVNQKPADHLELKKIDEDGKKQKVIGDNIAMDDQKFVEKRLPLGMNENPENLPGNAGVYYRAKEFAKPEYKKSDKVELRTDFRQTIFWSGDIDIDHSGRKVIEFCNSDDISSFRATVEGISSDGMAGHGEMVYFTQLPFSMSTKVPVVMVTGDVIAVPLTMKNNANWTLNGSLKIEAPAGLKALTVIPDKMSISSNSVITNYLEYTVTGPVGEGEFKISYCSEGLNDAFTQKVKIIAKGFPVLASFSGNDHEHEYSVDLHNIVEGSVTASVTAYPSVVSDLMKGVESILQEPSGCFEQTSMSSYPNVMVMDYLKTTGNTDDKLLASTEKLLDRGYKRLTIYETKEKGYEWFGGAPAHEALTAYGLMQFNDMKGVYKDIDQKMIDRTAEWLLSRKDGNGGFKRNSRALDNFGGANEDITDGYIVYALAEAGYTRSVEKESEKAYKTAMDKKDPYLLALAANAMFACGDTKKGDKALEVLYPMQNANGSWEGKLHSITRSTGQSLIIETTSLVILGILKSDNGKRDRVNKAVEYLVKSRSGYGAFGSTQGTILALKALTEYAKKSKQTKENGTLEFYVDGKKVAEQSYKAGENNPVSITGMEKYIKEGKHNLRIRYAGVKDPLPYSIAVTWNTFLPSGNKECSVDLSAKLSAKTCKVGETVRLGITLKNKTNAGLPSTVAIIGLPAGLSAQPWQLKELQEKKMFDYYEITGNNIVIYYRQMAPSEIKQINFDLKAEIPGEFEAPASSAYLYYTNEFKNWCALDKIVIEK